MIVFEEKCKITLFAFYNNVYRTLSFHGTPNISFNSLVTLKFEDSQLFQFPQLSKTLVCSPSTAFFKARKSQVLNTKTVQGLNELSLDELTNTLPGTDPEVSSVG